jgi:hypothetical protein
LLNATEVVEARADLLTPIDPENALVEEVFGP